MAYSTHYENALRLVADDACDLAVSKAGGMLKTLKGGRNCFYPVVGDDVVGVGVNPEYHYLIYQERGFASFPMSASLGKTIPMLINGQLVFRKVTGINQFRSGHRNYWQRDSDGELIPVYRQRRAWVHPGMGPKNFMRDAIDEAIERDQPMIDEAMLYDAYEDLEESMDRRYYG